MSDEKTILVIGDLMLDRRVEGHMSRVSPEAPAPVVNITALSAAPGGAANVAMNVASLGRKVQLVGAVGNDLAGRVLHETLSGTEGVWSRLVVDEARQTTVKTRITCGGQQVLRLDEEDCLHADAAIIQGLQAAMAAAPIGAVIVSDYNKGVMSAAVQAVLGELCRQQNVPVFVDTKPENMYRYRGAACITPNLVEAERAAAACVHPALAKSDTAAADRAAILGQYLQKELQAQYIVVTCGAAGAVAITREGQTQHYATQPCHVYDVTGAGDTFLAALVVGLLTKGELDYAVPWANLAAGLAVQQHGVVAIQHDDVEDAREKQLGIPAKLMDLPTLVEFVARAKRRNKRVVFTNGAFDLLHPGHLYLLDQAHRQGDVLVVAYNSDASVKQAKGPERPLIPEDWRGVCLAMVGYVDAVIRFEEDTPIEIIKHIRPDVLVKGAEYVEQFVAGADFVVTHGGQVHFVPMFTGFSTTAIKAKLEGEPSTES